MAPALFHFSTAGWPSIRFEGPKNVRARTMLVSKGFLRCLWQPSKSKLSPAKHTRIPDRGLDAFFNGRSLALVHLAPRSDRYTQRENQLSPMVTEHLEKVTHALYHHRTTAKTAKSLGNGGLVIFSLDREQRIKRRRSTVRYTRLTFYFRLYIQYMALLPIVHIRWTVVSVRKSALSSHSFSQFCWVAMGYFRSTQL